MTTLQWVQLASVGFEQLLPWNLPERGVRATHAQGVFDVLIGEWCVAMMVNMARDLSGMFRNQQQAVWDSAQSTNVLALRRGRRSHNRNSHVDDRQHQFPYNDAVAPRHRNIPLTPRKKRMLRTATILFLAISAAASASEPIDIGGRREPFVDDYLIERFDGAELRLQQPIPREVAIVHDKPWEGNICAYHTVMQDGDLYRLY
ncbi:MAG: hypothetical protein ABGZ17_20720 [Planctomycetaceae bacterium]